MRGSTSIRIPLSSRLVNYDQKSVGHPLQGGSLSVHALTSLLVLAKNIRDRNQIKYGKVGLISLWNPLSLKKRCMCASKCLFAICISVCVPWRQGSSVCVHAVVGWLRCSSQRGRGLRFGGAFLVSALIEQHVGCFSLQRDDIGLVYTPTKGTPDTREREPSDFSG